MQRFLYITLLVSILLSACGSLPGLNPTATSTPPPSPTNTAEPTLTPLPTDTPTPIPTSTPDAAATQAAQATETAADVLAELDKYLGDDSGIAYQAGHLAWQQTETLEVNLTGPDESYLAIADDLKASDFIFKADVTWEASGLLLCGAAFRAEPDLERGKNYLFSYLRLSGLPAWWITFNQYGRNQNSPTDVRFSGALDLANGSTNRFILVAQDNEFTVYINRIREGRFFDNSSQRSNGVFGFYGSQDSGKGSCEFENAWIWSLDK